MDCFRKNILLGSLLLQVGFLSPLVAQESNSVETIVLENTPSKEIVDDIEESNNTQYLTIEDAFLQGLLDDSLYELFDKMIAEKHLLESKLFEATLKDVYVTENLPFGELLSYKYYGLMNETERNTTLLSNDSGLSYDEVLANLPNYYKGNRDYATLIGDDIYYSTIQKAFNETNSIRNYNRFITQYSVEDKGTLETLKDAYNAYVSKTKLFTLADSDFKFEYVDNPASVYTYGTTDSFNGLYGFINFLDSAGYDVELIRVMNPNDNLKQDAWLRVYIKDVPIDIDPLRDETFIPRKYTISDESLVDTSPE